MSQRPTAAEEERLELLAEECGEVVRACMKILRHGWTATDYSVDPPHAYDNRRALERELGDVVAAMRLACRANDIRKEEAEIRAELKLNEVGRYTHFQPKELLRR